MDSATAIQQLRADCNQISAQITHMHPLVPKLNDPAPQSEVVEVVKKHLIKLEKGDGSTLV
jgi:hypothetical protein